MKPKGELIRIVKNDDAIVVNAGNKVNGRGFYVCKSEDCVSACCKRKSINKALSCNVDDDVYNQLNLVIGVENEIKANALSKLK
jgi:predicted RNA-binding protein YlxR (DUF448 family)